MPISGNPWVLQMISFLWTQFRNIIYSTLQCWLPLQSVLKITLLIWKMLVSFIVIHHLSSLEARDENNAFRCVRYVSYNHLSFGGDMASRWFTNGPNALVIELKWLADLGFVRHSYHSITFSRGFRPAVRANSCSKSNKCITWCIL